MVDAVFLFGACWVSIVIVTLMFILLLGKQLHVPASVISRGLVHELKSLLLGICLTDIAVLLLTGLFATSAWILGNKGEEEHCVHPSWASIPVIAIFGSLTLSVVWMRHSYLMKNVRIASQYELLNDTKLNCTSPVGTSTENKQGKCSVRHRYSVFKLCVTGPTNSLICTTVVLALLVLIAENIIDITPGVFVFKLCLVQINEPFISRPALAAAVIIIHILSWLTASMTKRTIDSIRQDNEIDTNNTKDVVEKDKAQCTVCDTQSAQNNTYSTLHLFLAMASVWLPTVQCIFICVIMLYSTIVTFTTLLLVWIYSCFVCLISVSLSFITFITSNTIRVDFTDYN